MVAIKLVFLGENLNRIPKKFVGTQRVKRKVNLTQILGNYFYPISVS